MKETYPKQQQSAAPTPTPPPPQTPKPASSKSSKSSKSSNTSASKPAYVKYYNPDHTENEPAFFSDEVVEEVFGNIYPMGAYTIKEGKPFTPRQERIEQKTTEFVFGNAYDALSTTAEEFISTAINTLDNVPIGIGDLAKTQISSTLGILGFCIDLSGMVNDGVDENKALAAAFIHAAVGFGVGMFLANAGLGVGFTILLTLLFNVAINKIVDSIIMV